MDDNEPVLSLSQIDIQHIPSIDPIASSANRSIVNELPPLSKVGYQLSKFILWIITGFIIFIVSFILFRNPDASSQIKIPSEINISDSSFNNKVALIKVIQEEKKSYRDFIVQISQMILLNLLLPTLTAILGYIFGSKGESRT